MVVVVAWGVEVVVWYAVQWWLVLVDDMQGSKGRVECYDIFRAPRYRTQNSKPTFELCKRIREKKKGHAHNTPCWGIEGKIHNVWSPSSHTMNHP